MDVEKTLTVRCAHCGGEMAPQVMSRFNPGFGIAILVMGLVFSLFVPVFGLPIVVIGAYIGWASRTVWSCAECGAMIDRAVQNRTG